jgi:hypothetical protein
VSAAGQVGSAAGTVSPEIAGVSATGFVGNLLSYYWELVDDSQSASWQNLNNDQTPGWADVDTDELTDWVEITT